MALAAGLSTIPALTSEGATAFQYKSTGSVASSGLTIRARNGHRRTLIDLHFEPEAAGVFLNIQIGDRTFIRLPTTLGDYSNVPSGTINAGVGAILDEAITKDGHGLLWYLSQLIPFDFPTAAQDEDIIITPEVGVLSYGSIPGTYVISAKYKDQTEGDVVSKSVPGGSANPRRIYINDMSNVAAQLAAGQTPLDKSLTPAGLNGIADNEKMTAGLKFTGYAFLYDASALGTTTGVGANGKPTRIHITDVDTDLYTVEDQEGLLIDRDLANMLSFDAQQGIVFAPDQPYVFHQNRNFRFLLDTSQKVGAGSNFAALTQYFAVIGIREPEVAGA